MNKEDYINKIHSEIIDIADCVVNLCNKHNLKYYLICGTLLGAVRHNGFIPWDDDFDIVMPRADFEKFVHEYYTELDPCFYLDWIDINPHYNHVFAKVCKGDTLFEEPVGEKTTTKRGIFIDIFPLDFTDGCSKDVMKRKRKYKFWAEMLFKKSYSSEKKWVKKIIFDMYSEKSLYNYALKYMLGKNRSGSFYSNFGSQYNIEKQTFPISYFGEGLDMQFEGRKYRCPKRYKDILASIYGENYMKLPPIEKRRTHYPVRVIFSDMEEVYFGRIENMIVVGGE